MTYLSDGKYASPPDELTALVLEAHRRGVSYGQLVGGDSRRAGGVGRGGHRGPEADRPEEEAPPSAAPEPPKEDGPEVYRKIENILAALPGDMGQKARWAAEKMVAEVFAEYLKVRLRVEENEEEVL